MTKIISMILLLVVLSACGPSTNVNQQVTDDLYDGGDGNASTSQMVDANYYLTGELLEKDDLSLLIDTEEAGLVWVRFESLPEIEMTVRSTVRVLYGGEIMESYPGQAHGTSVEILEPFDEDFVRSFDDMVEFLDNADVYHVVEWNNLKDHVAYAQVDDQKETLAYFIRIASLYDEESKLVGYVEGELPDLAWFYDTLQIQTAESFTDVYPPYNEVEVN